MRSVHLIQPWLLWTILNWRMGDKAMPHSLVQMLPEMVIQLRMVSHDHPSVNYHLSN